MKKYIYKVHLELMPMNVQDVKLCHDQEWLKQVELKRVELKWIEMKRID